MRGLEADSRSILPSSRHVDILSFWWADLELKLEDKMLAGHSGSNNNLVVCAGRPMENP